MLDLNKEIKIETKDGIGTSFHIADSVIIPLSNFNQARSWYYEGRLTTESQSEMTEFLEIFLKHMQNRYSID